MEPTRRLWSVSVLAVGAAVLAVLLDSPLFLGVPLGVGVWVLAHQVAFARSLAALRDAAPVAQSLSRETVLVDDTTLLTIQLATDATSLLAFDPVLSVQPSPALEPADARTHELTEETRTLTVPLRVQVAGSYTVEPPRIRFTSPGGLFRESLELGNPVTVTGEPRVPREIHIGTGGETIAVAYGEHDAEHGSSGFEPGELREYLPGDPANRIDWKATARTGEPHVREFEAETTRQTQLLVDRRPSMRAGQSGETKLDYGREIAVWLTEYVASLDDPLGLTFVSDDQLTTITAPQAGTESYQRIRRELLDLNVGEGQQSSTTTTRDHSHRTTAAPWSESDAAGIESSDDPFSSVLRSYVEHAHSVHPVTDEPLFKAVQTLEADHAETAWLVVITDDRHRGELLEIARTAATRDRFVTFFVLPSVLFERPTEADVTATYEAYQNFESFRQQLATQRNVTAFEVGPRDRLEGLLESTHTRRAQQ